MSATPDTSSPDPSLGLDYAPPLDASSQSTSNFSIDFNQLLNYYASLKLAKAQAKSAGNTAPSAKLTGAPIGPSSGMNKWLIYGGAAAAILIIVLVVAKR